MRIAIMQPYLFPYIGYYQLIHSVNKFVVYDDVSYIKQGWINKNHIMVNCEKKPFVVPVKSASSFKSIAETEVNYNINWQTKMLRMIGQSYSKAPQYKEVFPIINQVLESGKSSISEIAVDSLTRICQYLEIETKFEKSENYNNTHLKGAERVLDICLKEEANHYLNPIGGINLYSKDSFKKRNVELSFLQAGNVIYDQPSKNFVEGLSIIDILMNNSVETVQSFLNDYTLV